MSPVDLVLGATLVALGIAVVSLRDLRVGAVAFIAFGLLLALAWARLGAADVALAEAAIGAGVTGALVIDAATALGGAARPRARRNGTRRA